MLVYEGIKRDFLNDVVNDYIAESIENKIREMMHRETLKNEFRSG